MCVKERSSRVDVGVRTPGGCLTPRRHIHTHTSRERERDTARNMQSDGERGRKIVKRKHGKEACTPTHLNCAIASANQCTFRVTASSTSCGIPQTPYVLRPGVLLLLLYYHCGHPTLSLPRSALTVVQSSPYSISRPLPVDPSQSCVRHKSLHQPTSTPPYAYCTLKYIQ